MAGLYIDGGGTVITGSQPGLPSIPSLVASMPGGNAVYTTALVTQAGEVIDWPWHEGRLIRGALGLHKCNPDFYPGLFAPLAGMQQEDEVLRAAAGVVLPAVRRRVKQALDAYIHHSPQTLPAMCFCILATRHKPEVYTMQDSEQTSGPPVDLHVLVQPVPLLANTSPSGAAQVLLYGPPRSLAQIKHTSWMILRKQLEATKQEAGMTEVLLSDEGGNVLEGLISGFAVIIIHETGDGTQQVEFQTAQLDVLPSLSMRRILQAAHNLGWRVTMTAPHVSQRHTWSAALICNCLRNVVPVCHIKCPAESSRDSTAWSLDLPYALPQLSALQHEVTAVQERWRLDSPAWQQTPDADVWLKDT